MTTLLVIVASMVPLLGAGDVQGDPSLTGPPDPVGVYRLAPGRLIGVRALEEGRFRYIDFTTGESHTMHPTGPGQYRSASDWSSETPVALRYRFFRAADGTIRSLEVRSASGTVRQATRVRLPSRPLAFSSKDVRLSGRLILPDSGAAPYPVVIYVHGSDTTSAVNTVALPYFWAANGVAAFIYDKRGTGQSQGSYTQMFPVLASDVVAAVDRLKQESDVDAQRIGVAGFSQGGWVAPLAAVREPAIRFAFIGYGLAMSVAEEDRLEAPEKVRALGFEDDAVREFEDLNAVIHRAARAGFTEEGWSRIAAKIDEYRGRAWMEAVENTQTWAGQLLTMGLEQAREVVPQMFRSYVDPFYDPVPTLRSLQIPMMWMIAGEDIEAPPGPTIQTLNRLRKAGKPFELMVFPGADHGLTTFETLPSGGRVKTGYVPGYFCTMMAWLRQQSMAQAYADPPSGDASAPAGAPYPKGYQ